MSVTQYILQRPPLISYIKYFLELELLSDVLSKRLGALSTSRTSQRSAPRAPLPVSRDSRTVSRPTGPPPHRSTAPPHLSGRRDSPSPTRGRRSITRAAPSPSTTRYRSKSVFPVSVERTYFGRSNILMYES